MFFLRRTDVFISYSPKDAQHCERLKTHLAFYEKKGTLTVWEESRLAPGSLWRAEMEKAISKTRIAILLISADFLNSSLIMEDQIPPLLFAAKTEEVIIIPVIVGACAFQETDLAQFYPANDPLKPLDGMSPAKRDKIWAELATVVNTELSKDSGGYLSTGLSFSTDPLEYSGSNLYRVRDLSRLRDIMLSTSAPPDLFMAFGRGDPVDYAIIDLDTGKRWLTSRLYIFALTLERMLGLQRFVFLESGQRFLGIASLTKVRWRLARRYPWLETAFAKVYADVSDHIHISSDTGAFDTRMTQEVVGNFLSHPSIQQPFAPSASPDPDDSRWEALRTVDGRFWEHARWLDAARLRQDLGDVLQQDESIWLKESPHISPIELVRCILRRKAPLVALVDEEKRFRSLIDRQALLERTVADSTPSDFPTSQTFS